MTFTGLVFTGFESESVNILTSLLASGLELITKDFFKLDVAILSLLLIKDI